LQLDVSINENKRKTAPTYAIVNKARSGNLLLQKFSLKKM
jgi:hypothetical protein